MCCGRARPSFRPGGIVDAPAMAGAVFEYVGRTALTVTGPATGVVYRFAAPGARQKVDPRDRPALMKVPILRMVATASSSEPR
jgi:hypothetical protein